MTQRQHPEDIMQTRLCNIIRINARPEIVWGANPNGDLRAPNVAARLKRQGVRAGMPDLVFCLDDGRTAWLELKAKGGRLSIAQKAVGFRLRRVKHLWAVAWSLEEAVEILQKWGIFKNNFVAKENMEDLNALDAFEEELNKEESTL